MAWLVAPVAFFVIAAAGGWLGARGLPRSWPAPLRFIVATNLAAAVVAASAIALQQAVLLREMQERRDRHNVVSESIDRVGPLIVGYSQSWIHPGAPPDAQPLSTAVSGLAREMILLTVVVWPVTLLAAAPFWAVFRRPPHSQRDDPHHTAPTTSAVAVTSAIPSTSSATPARTI